MTDGHYIEARKGRKALESAIEKRRQSLRLYYQTHTVWNRNVPHTEATRIKISQSLKQYWAKRKKESSKEY